jgi:hypothetical protein
MAPGDHPDGGEPGAGVAGWDAAAGGTPAAPGESYWVQWHAPYEDQRSTLSLRLRTVQSMVGAALDELPARSGPVRVVSLCAGQGRDVIDVVATHPRGPEVSALLVEQDRALADFARARAAAAGVSDRIRVVEGDASQSRHCADDVPADIVLVCGVFGNISVADIAHTIQAMPGWCAAGGHVIWTRHRGAPDRTPAVRAAFGAAGFTEVAFVTPEGTIQAIGHHRLDGEVAPFNPEQQLFDFVGDGRNPL